MKEKKSITNNHKQNAEELNNEVEILMKKFLYEVFKELCNKRLNKSQLASLLGVSPGYLSQIFHGKKPLTFEMLIKVQQALQIEFQIKAIPANY